MPGLQVQVVFVSLCVEAGQDRHKVAEEEQVRQGGEHGWQD